jgi:hypothetical protein
MLTITSSNSGRTCDGVSRRDFVKIGSLGMGGLALSDLMRGRAQAGGSQSKPTSVVWLWLSGGATHVETFDPKPDAPVEFRSTTGSVKTKLPGVELGGTFEKLGQIADKMVFVRSFAHRNSGHGGGTHWVMTGYNNVSADNGGRADKPGMGSILSRFRGPNASTGLPTYVKMNGILGDGPSWLGSSYAPFEVAGKARQNLNLTLKAERLNDRRGLLDAFDSTNREVDASGLMNGLDSFETQAFDLILGSARDAFDITRESATVRSQYGKGLGEQLLMARRLCENGVGFVTINYGGWDMHGQIAAGMKRRGTEVDQAVSTFINDLHERGMNENVLLVISGEFGRTPRINTNGGRDHWAPLSTLALAGGGLKMGQVVGESMAKAEAPKSNPISPQDLMATVFHVLGIPQNLHYQDPTGRPTAMIQGGKPIAELV